MKITQGPALFEIDRQEAFRRVLHFSIRQIVRREDPFGIHLSVQACAQISRDLGKHLGITIADISSLLRPEHVKEWMTIYKATYNYLKHADKDADATLAVRDLPSLNRFQTLLNASNYTRLYATTTSHIKLYNVYFASTEPNARKMLQLDEMIWEIIDADETIKDRSSWSEFFEKSPDIISEYETDTAESLFRR